MRLTQWTDYSLRVLMYCAAQRERAQPATISEIAEVHQISRSHLMKVVQQLGALGLLENTRGRGGGIRLAKAPADIRIGDVVRATEPDFGLVACMQAHAQACGLAGHCALEGVLETATERFLETLNGRTLEDLVPAPQAARVGSGKARRLPGIPVVAA